MATRQQQWYDTKKGAFWVGGISLVLAYLVGSRGINTGSWWEYLFTLIFLIVGFNRLIAALQFADKGNNRPRQSSRQSKRSE